jgi:hypothetical protein
MCDGRTIWCFVNGCMSDNINARSGCLRICCVSRGVTNNELVCHMSSVYNPAASISSRDNGLVGNPGIRLIFDQLTVPAALDTRVAVTPLPSQILTEV